jgi:hypothetical protein
MIRRPASATIGWKTPAETMQAELAQFAKTVALDP